MLRHTVSYFRRNPQCKIEPLFCVVEQQDSVPFNRGSLLNHGYRAVQSVVDYVCFHDCDYLPVWADYSEPSLPTRIVWWGLHQRPIGHGTTHNVTAAKYGLGGVSVMKKSHVELVNGYSNQYWGWGFEDTDMVDRLTINGLPLGQRDGTFTPLDHDSNGYTAHEVPTPAHIANKKRYENKLGKDFAQDGLNQPIGTVINKTRNTVCGLQEHELAPLWWVQVDLSQHYDVVDPKAQ